MTTPALPTTAAARKAIPVYSGFIKYFPRAIAAVAELSRVGNDQHNPGQPLHWDRSKSGDERDALMRHLLDEAAGVPTDTDGIAHATKVAWRAMAALEKILEDLEVEPGRVSLNRLEKINQSLLLGVDELELTTRSKNCLKAEGIQYVHQLVCFSERDLAKTPNMGAKSMKEIKEVLGCHGLTFSMSAYLKQMPTT